MNRLTLKVTSNPFPVDTQWGVPIKYNRVRISKLYYKPSSNANKDIEFKIDTGGKFDKNIEISTGKPYFYIQYVIQGAAVGLANLSGTNDWDYCDCSDSKYLTDFTMKFYEDDALISSPYLASNNVFMELIFS